MQFWKKATVILMIVVLSAQVLAGCTSRDDVSDDTTPSTAAGSRPEAKEGTVGEFTPDFSAIIEEHYERNEDTIGWLQVPGTSIEDVVVQKVDDPTNLYYERKDFEENYNFNGVYWADFRAKMGDGTRDTMGPSLNIYGHAIVDDPEDERYFLKFGELHDFRDEDFARKNPYIYFSTAQENMAYEIMAVFVCNADNTAISYNDGSMSQEDYVKMVREEVIPRSKYIYDVDIQDDDKFIVLSACIYTLDNGVNADYPSGLYRYCIMGRLCDPDETLKSEAVFEVNENVFYDPLYNQGGIAIHATQPEDGDSDDAGEEADAA